MTVVAKEASGNIVDQFSIFKTQTNILKAARMNHAFCMHYGQLSFNAPKAGLYQMQLFALNGKVVSSMSRLFSQGAAHIKMVGLTPGAYNVRIDGNGALISGMVLAK